VGASAAEACALLYGARDGPITGVGAAGGQACLEAGRSGRRIRSNWPRLSRFAALRIDSPYALRLRVVAAGTTVAQRAASPGTAINPPNRRSRRRNSVIAACKSLRRKSGHSASVKLQPAYAISTAGSRRRAVRRRSAPTGPHRGTGEHVFQVVRVTWRLKLATLHLGGQLQGRPVRAVRDEYVDRQTECSRVLCAVAASVTPVLQGDAGSVAPAHGRDAHTFCTSSARSRAQYSRSTEQPPTSAAGRFPPLSWRTRTA